MQLKFNQINYFDFSSTTHFANDTNFLNQPNCACVLGNQDCIYFTPMVEASAQELLWMLIQNIYHSFVGLQEIFQRNNYYLFFRFMLLGLCCQRQQFNLEQIVLSQSISV
eukprot:TRINITY_DN7699_c0_g1_i4.p6 TRINITY_DN7699_c0_g1~~TRINITY_DN7699_c0_g1_i4.p6  ORF type:complete len:110 (-),score=1.41 TRINITY_DN7699_c0_g1_i4:1317-1646(-)